MYIGYDKQNLSTLNEIELKNELKAVDKEIEDIEQEMALSKDNNPTYVLKEQLENAKDRKNKLEKALENVNKNKYVGDNNKRTDYKMTNEIDKTNKKIAEDKEKAKKKGEKISDNFNNTIPFQEIYNILYSVLPKKFDTIDIVIKYENGKCNVSYTYKDGKDTKNYRETKLKESEFLIPFKKVERILKPYHDKQGFSKLKIHINKNGTFNSSFEYED